jgi:transglutaminase/protease-like cytokinesis protein 3
MPFKKFFFILLFSAFIHPLFSQNYIRIPNLDYAEVDDYALTISGTTFNNVDSLIVHLTKFDKQHFKMRAIFRWVTENIAFDCYGNKHSNKAHIEANDVFKTHTAIAEGYANLLKMLCTKAGIPCEVVKGYFRNEYLIPGSIINRPNHFWNVVKLYNKWYLMDVTLASGRTDKSGKLFTKKFNDTYYAIHPRQMILTHLPLNGEKQYLDTIINTTAFFNFPQVHDGFYNLNIYALSPAKGVIEISENCTKNFSFKTMDSLTITHIELIESNSHQKKEISFIQKQNVISFGYDFKKSKKNVIDIYANGSQMASYVVISKKKKRIKTDSN